MSADSTPHSVQDVAAVREALSYSAARVGRQLGYMDHLDEINKGRAALDRLEEQHAAVIQERDELILAADHWRRFCMDAETRERELKEQLEAARAENRMWRKIHDIDPAVSMLIPSEDEIPPEAIEMGRKLMEFYRPHERGSNPASRQDNSGAEIAQSFVSEPDE